MRGGRVERLLVYVLTVRGPKEWLFLLGRKDRQVVELIFGLEDGICRTRAEVARLLGVHYMRIKQQYEYAMVEIFDAAETSNLPDNLIPVAAKLSKYRETLEKIEARLEATKAIKRGDVIRQPCEECGSDAQGHHDDYSKPLELRWLCRVHHDALHYAQRHDVSANNSVRNIR